MVSGYSLDWLKSVTVPGCVPMLFFTLILTIADKHNQGIVYFNMIFIILHPLMYLVNNFL